MAAPRGLRTQDGNIVVITSPNGKGYEVYELQDGLEMYLTTVPVNSYYKVRDTLVRLALSKHVDAEIKAGYRRAATRVASRFWNATRAR